MKALALATALSVVLSCAVSAQDSQSGKSNGARKSSMEAAATPSVDVAAIQKKIDAYTEAIKNDPKNDKYYAARGQNYRHLLKWDLAIADMSRAIELKPSEADYLEERGCYYAQTDRDRDAAKDFGTALAKTNRTHRLLMRYAHSLLQIGDFKSSAKYAKEALSLKPDDVDALILLGSAEQVIGELEDSLTHLGKAIVLKPNSARALRLRSLTYKAMGKLDLAQADLDRSKKLAP